MDQRIIRINKVLRELNISLERAVDFLDSKGIKIESNPNTKIDNETYLILANQFKTSNSLSIKSKKNMIDESEIESNKLKPKVILEIEKRYKVSLKGRMHQIYKRNEFLMDDKNIIIGLNLADNNIVDISIFKKLKKLKYLDLSNNNIKDIDVLKELIDLEVLIIKGNQISDISSLKELKNLKELNLSLNNIMNFSILNNFKILKKIDLSSNFIDDLKQLEFIVDLPSLELTIDNNPYFSYNNIILQKTENHYKIVINELKKILDDIQISAILPEKILLLGNHASGKSSFLYYLQNEKLDYNHDTTHVLNIEKYPHTYDKLPKAIIYDFGGQDFYHGVYQTFLSANCITLLFWNTITNENIVLLNGDSRERPNRNFNTHYWLGQRRHKNMDGDVLLIQTQSDNEKSNRKSYINSYSEISNEFYVSLEKEVKGAIKKKLKHINLKYLKESLLDLISFNQQQKNSTGKMSQPYYNFVKFVIESPTNHLSISYEELYKKYPIDSNERFEVDLEQLKRQGLILVNKDNVWLSPVGLTEYVHKKILKEDIIGKGIIKKSTFEDHNFDPKIIELLIKEKVLFIHKYGLSSENKVEVEYIIPNYLPQIVNSGIDYDLMTFGLDNPLFILKFKDYLPFGLINQLICYFGNLPDRKKFWREHLIFTIDKNVKILIELDFKNLKIKVFGVYTKDVNQKFKNDIESYLFYIIMAMYWDFNLLPKTFKEFKDYYEKIIQNNEKKVLDIKDEMKFMENFYFEESCRPDDLYISKDDKVYVKYDILCTNQASQTKIKTYTFHEQNEIKENLLVTVSDYQNFTPKKLKKMKKVFISYSHDDLIYRKELQSYLVNLERDNKIEIWHDGLIEAGVGWNEKILEKLKESDIIILLISQTFISSKYIHEVEMKKAIELKIDGQSKIVPILVSNCDWNNWNIFLEKDNLDFENIDKGKLNKYQLMPMNEENQRLEAINKWKYPEDAWTKIIKQIRDFADN